MLRYTGISIVLTVISFHLYSQNLENGLYVYGQITELNLSDSSESSVRSVPVIVVCDSTIIVNSTTTNSGRYQFKVPFGYAYEIRYGGEKYIRKTLVIDATDPSAKTLRRGYRLELDISLFDSENENARKVLETPFARGEFTRKSSAIQFDKEFNENALKTLKRALDKD